MTNELKNTIEEAKTEELKTEQLDQVAGGAHGSGGGSGKVSMQDFHFVASTNKASPKLF